GVIVVLEVHALEHEICDVESHDCGFSKGLPGGEPARAPVSAVLPSVPEEETIEDLVVLVASADFHGIEAETGKKVSRVPCEVGAFQSVLVVVDIAPVGGGGVDAASREGEHAADASLERAVRSGIVEGVQTNLVGGLEPLVRLVDGPERPFSIKPGVAF